jgi:hypothetical protein
MGPICKKYMLPLDDARDKCFAVSGEGRGRKKKPAMVTVKPSRAKGLGQKKKRSVPVKHPRAESWPVVARGWGPITRNGEGAKP